MTDSMCKMDAALGGVFKTIGICVGDWEVAEEECARAIEKYGDTEQWIDAAWRICYRTSVFPETLNAGLYRLHCREIFERAVQGPKDADMNEPTGVEVMALICGTYEIAPLKSELLYWFFETYPELIEFVGIFDDEEPAIGYYDGYTIWTAICTAFSKGTRNRQKEWLESIEFRRQLQPKLI